MKLKFLKLEMPEKDTLIQVTLALVLIIGLIAVSSYVKYIETPNFKKAVHESVTLVTHLRFIQLQDPLMFIISLIGPAAPHPPLLMPQD